MNIVFFGSSDFSVPVLLSLLSKHRIGLVVTTPDKKRGRGQKLSGTIVKDFALSHRLTVSQPDKLASSGLTDQIKELNPDFIVIASYGRLVPSSIYTLAKIAPLNVHPSLLPRHRGASPIQRTLLEGDLMTGVSIAEVTKDLDAGDLFAQLETVVEDYETTCELSQRLSKMAGELILDVIEKAALGSIRKIRQDPSKATYAKKINKDEGKINWSMPSRMIHNQVRAYHPWPGSFTFFHGKRLKILETDFKKNNQPLRAGSIISIDQDGILVQTQSDSVLLKQVQLEGRKEVSAYEFALGQRIQREDHFE